MSKFNQNKKEFDIVILDSGVRTTHKCFDSYEMNSISFSYVNGIPHVENDTEDFLGHGTAVNYIIRRNIPLSVTILSIKICYNPSVFETTEDLLVGALEYIYSCVNCKIINISMGINVCYDELRLTQICQKLHDKNVIIVSAFDNLGGVSYPAVLPSVFGVESSEDCYSVDEYEFIENSVVNFRAKGGIQKVAWNSPDYILTRGNSFACAYMTAHIANKLFSNRFDDKNQLLSYLKHNAKAVITCSNPTPNNSIPLHYFQPTKAVLFPINKETHSLIAFNELLSFPIIHYTDIPQSGKTHRELRDIIQHLPFCSSPNSTIENINSLNWGEDFDTIIVGHSTSISQLLRKDILMDILTKCIQYGKNIISFSDLSQYNSLVNTLCASGHYVYYPSIDSISHSDAAFGKLYLIPQPVVCVAGTSSSQGKFTLQLELRKEFINRGYKVGQLGTEPSSKLFGFDEVYHYGYEVNRHVMPNETIQQVNSLMKNISKKSPDIILAGIQSATIPYVYSNVNYLTYKQFELLFGILPDVVILCINPFDDISYINRTISSIENYANSHVMCCVLYPQTYNNHWVVFQGKHTLSPEERAKLIQTISENVNLPCYDLSEPLHIKSIVDQLIDYF